MVSFIYVAGITEPIPVSSDEATRVRTALSIREPLQVTQFKGTNGMQFTVRTSAIVAVADR